MRSRPRWEFRRIPRHPVIDMDCRNCASSFRWERGGNMDEQDKQFESYLRQFRLRKPRSLPEIASMSRRSSMRWVLAAAAVVLVAGLSTLILHNAGNVSGPKVT